MARRKARPIRASDISVYLYCARAWWYVQQGEPPPDLIRLRAGTQAHWAHGRQVRRAWWLRLAGYALLALALIGLAVYLALQAVSTP